MFDAIISFFEPIFTWFQGFIDGIVLAYRITTGALSSAGHIWMIWFRL